MKFLHCVALNGSRLYVTQLTDNAEVEHELTGQTSMKFLESGLPQAVQLCKNGKWTEAETQLSHFFEAVTLQESK